MSECLIDSHLETTFITVLVEIDSRNVCTKKNILNEGLTKGIQSQFSEVQEVCKEKKPQKKR